MRRRTNSWWGEIRALVIKAFKVVVEEKEEIEEEKEEKECLVEEAKYIQNVGITPKEEGKEEDK